VFKSEVNRFMAAQVQINAEHQRTIDALIETNNLLLERLARLERDLRSCRPT
jgi:hypothetical protein